MVGKFSKQPRFILASSCHPHFNLKWLQLLSPILNEDVESLRNRRINIMISFMQAIKSKASSDTNTVSTEDSGMEVSRKVSGNEDFFDKVYTEEEPSQRTRDEFSNLSYEGKAFVAVQNRYLPICSKIQTY